MKKKAKPKQLRQNIANLIDLKGVLSRPDKGQFQYIKIPVMMSVSFSDKGIFFELSYFNKRDENWCAKFRYGIKDKEPVRGFVDFIRAANALNADPDKEVMESKKVLHITSDIKNGLFMYTVRPIWFQLVLLDDEVKFDFTFVQKVFDHWGITLDYQIEGKKQTEAFVEFILKAYEFIRQKEK
ncbi:MAG: hypothetical protein V1709_10900 [Planctomycetota bacterium]